MVVTSLVKSQETLTPGQANLQPALADLKLSQQNCDRHQQITATDNCPSPNYSFK